MYFLFLFSIFNFSIAILLVLPSDRICSQVHVLTSYCACVAVIDNSSIQGYAKLGFFCLKAETEKTFETCFFKKLDDAQSFPPTPTQKRFAVNFSRSWLSVLISGPFKIGLIGCPETSVRIYHSVLPNIPQERRSRLTTGRCIPWFSWASGSERSG